MILWRSIHTVAVLLDEAGAADDAFHRSAIPLVRPWEPISSAPIERPIEAWVKRVNGEQYRLPFPITMTRITTGHSEHGLWVNAETDEALAVYPSFWREWHGRA